MISPKVMVELHQAKLVPTQFTVTKPGEHAWSSAEQRRFWEAIHRFPQGPWTAIAAYVGSKSTRQAMTHAQKLRQKLNRWKRRVRNDPNGAGAGSGASSPRSEALDMDNETDENENENENEEDEEADGGDERWRGDAESALKVECEEVSPGRVKSDLAAATRPQYAPYSSDVGYEGCSSRGGEQRYYHHQQPHHAPMKATLSFDVSSLSPADVSGGDHDEYLDHLLSDIEPMLENVVNFSSPSRAAYAPSAGTYHSHNHSSYHSSYLSQQQQQQAVGDSVVPQFPQAAFELSASPYSAQHQSAPAQGFASSVDFRL